MNSQARVNPWWAVVTVWGIVNMVNILQSLGFLSRVITGNRSINHLFGYGIIALALPVALTIVAFIREKTGLRQWIGPAAFLAFVVFMIVVEYIWNAEYVIIRKS